MKPWILDLICQKMKSWLCNSVVRNSRTFLLSPNLQRNTEVNKTLTQICICGTVPASLTNDGKLSHFDSKSHTYSVPLRWILSILYNILSVGNQTNWESSSKIFHSLPVLHITFNTSGREGVVPVDTIIKDLAWFWRIMPRVQTGSRRISPGIPIVWTLAGTSPGGPTKHVGSGEMRATLGS